MSEKIACLSRYERMRADNIASNRAKLQELGILSAKTEIRKDELTRRRKEKSEEEKGEEGTEEKKDVVRRRSKRTRNMPVPVYVVQDETLERDAEEEKDIANGWRTKMGSGVVNASVMWKELRKVPSSVQATFRGRAELRCQRLASSGLL